MSRERTTQLLDFRPIPFVDLQGELVEQLNHTNHLLPEATRLANITLTVLGVCFKDKGIETNPRLGPQLTRESVMTMLSQPVERVFSTISDRLRQGHLPSPLHITKEQVHAMQEALTTICLRPVTR